jgi:hypothetical protein
VHLVSGSIQWSDDISNNEHTLTRFWASLGCRSPSSKTSSGSAELDNDISEQFVQVWPMAEHIPFDMPYNNAHTGFVELLPHLDKLGEFGGWIRYV